ncbi:DegT/DnrJ/EryC1/StrS family aminotransferase [Tropicimonas sp. S265A]|uniref:DegT/DnrJ/EryC1/StrS family aminotransferase n=1 Tax=Tropicimonas sp. S265A TaxID=3415134 RepID=UPI003C7DD55B
MKPFQGNFTLQEPIPEAAIDAAVEVMRSGRLHRYNAAAEQQSPVAALEAAYADYQGARFCLACASGGAAMALALRAHGVGAGDKVLTNAFTLAPVPGAIAAVGAEAVLVEITEDLVLDLSDLDAKIGASGARTLLLSHMRGHLCDMEALCDLLTARGVTLIEDCAHTMGASWNGRKSGNFGLAGCFSAQTYKHVNSGEGGLLTSDDPDFIARAILLSGSYMLYDRHGAAPGPEAFASLRFDMPNMSSRMDNLRAAILLPQISTLDANVDRWNARYDLIAARLAECPLLRVPHRPAPERYVGSSIQFRVPGASADMLEAYVTKAAALGVDLKWFGRAEPVAFTSTHHSWRYVPAQSLPHTDRVLANLMDMRLPLTFSLEDCAHIADILVHCAQDLSLPGAA